jgi:hypothetical protein
MYLYEKSHSPISTHVTISRMQECDVISVSKSDYIYEDMSKDKQSRL